MPELEPELGLTALENLKARGRGARGKKERGSHERGTAGARPGLEARLCLCLGLIDFQENCSRPLPSSLMKPSGICHPITRPTPALQRSSLPPSSPPPLSRSDIRSQCTGARTQPPAQTHTCVRGHRPKLLVIHEQQTKDQ